MLTVEEALSAVLDRRGRCRREPVPLAEALGCVLAEDVAADIDLPPFDKSLVDGYAVRSEDLRRPGPTGSGWASRSWPGRRRRGRSAAARRP